jgi:pilus assembly protein Flp/PilA
MLRSRSCIRVPMTRQKARVSQLVSYRVQRYARGMGRPPPAASRRVLGMYTLLSRLIADERGATAIEYGLIAALIAVAAVGVMTTVGHNLSTTFNSIATKL